jgi:hypothetical protein
LRAELKVHAIISRQWGLHKQCVTTAEERLFKNYIEPKRKSLVAEIFHPRTLTVNDLTNNV